MLRRNIRIDVAAKRQHVFNAVGLKLLYLLVDVRMGGIHTGQVRDGLRVAVRFYPLDKVNCGCSGGASACTVGHADEIRVKIPQLIQRVVDNGNVVVLLGRENLKREHGSSVFEQFWYFHLSL